MAQVSPKDGLQEPPQGEDVWATDGPVRRETQLDQHKLPLRWLNIPLHSIEQVSDGHTSQQMFY